jgi:hypothetical protein
LTTRSEEAKAGWTPEYQGSGSGELEECGYEGRRVAEDSEKGQGPHRTVEPTMTMM